MDKWHGNCNCDGMDETCYKGETKRLPLTSDSPYDNNSAVYLCYNHFLKEMRWRTERNKELGESNQFKIFKWNELVYHPAYLD